tara:strand:+ start:57 stop:308 length:252 start_codon:yes stop_codon:yes gene_type:complete
MESIFKKEIIKFDYCGNFFELCEWGTDLQFCYDNGKDMRIWRLIGASFKRDLVIKAMKNDRDLALFFKSLRNLNVDSESIDWY